MGKAGDVIVFAPGTYVIAKWPEDRPPSKLAPLYQGPLIVIEQIGSNVYSCQDLTTLKVKKYPAAHLKEFVVSDMLDAVEVASKVKDVFIVADVIGHRYMPNKPRKYSNMEFLVHWEGFPDSENTWEPYKHLKNNVFLHKYSTAYPDLRIPIPS